MPQISAWRASAVGLVSLVLRGKRQRRTVFAAEIGGWTLQLYWIRGVILRRRPLLLQPVLSFHIDWSACRFNGAVFVFGSLYFREFVTDFTAELNSVLCLPYEFSTRRFFAQFSMYLSSPLPRCCERVVTGRYFSPDILSIWLIDRVQDSNKEQKFWMTRLDWFGIRLNQF